MYFYAYTILSAPFSSFSTIILHIISKYMIEEQLTHIIRKICSKQISSQVSVGKAVNVNPSARTCDILLNDDITLFDCRLNAVIDSYDNHITILPKENSLVAFLRLEGSSTSCLVISYTEIDRVLIQLQDTKADISSSGIILNDGSLGGLVNISQLTSKLNQLINAFNSHTHHVSTTGSASAQSGLAAPISSSFQSFNQSDYEDTKIKH